MKPSQIKVIGNLLSTYNIDLNYINSFQLYKKGKIPVEVYVKEGSGTIKSFIND